MAGDIYVSFGAETGELEAAMARSKAEVQALGRELAATAREMQRSGADMDSSLGKSLTEIGQKMAEAKSHMAELRQEMRGGDDGGVASFGEALEKALSPIASLKAHLSEIAELVVAAFAIEKIAEFNEAMARLGLETSKAATILGVPTQEIGGLKMIAEASGLSLEDLTTSFSRLSRNIADQSPNAKRALDALGLSFSSLKDKGASDQLKTLAESLSKIENGATKDAIAMELFGRAGVQMLPMLNEGRGAIEDWGQAADRAGTALGPGLVASMEAMHRQLTELNGAGLGLGIALWSEYHNQIEAAYKIMTDVVEAMTRAVNQSTLLGAAFGLLRAAVGGVEILVVSLIDEFEKFAAISDASHKAVIEAVKTMGQVIADVFSALGDGVPRFFAALAAAARESFGAVGRMASDLGEAIEQGLTGHFAAAAAAAGKISSEGGAALASMKSAFGGVFDLSKAAADQAAGADRVKAVWQGLGKDIAAIDKQTQDELALITRTGNSNQEKEAERHAAILAPSGRGGKGGGDKAARDAAGAARAGAEEAIALAERATEIGRAHV